MARKPVTAFLIKVVPLFFLFLYLWEARGLSALYHRLLAQVLDAICPTLDPTGTVARVVADGHDLLFRLVLGADRVTLRVNATDITSNTAMLIALYLASPIRRWKRFAVWMFCALVALFAVHVVTAVTVSQEALMSNPRVMAGSPFTRAQVVAVPRYNVFYEEMGMYLIVLLMWFPYLVTKIVEARRAADAGAAVAEKH